jgi:hypothetical protein
MDESIEMTITKKSAADRKSDNATQVNQQSGRTVKRERNLNNYDSNSIDEEEF